MVLSQILNRCDHTLLKQTATWAEIAALCDEAYEFNTASVCIPPSFVHKASHYVGDQVKICTVIGFPNGYNAMQAKATETKIAVDDGADEIDVVINIGALKEGNVDYVKKELELVRAACSKQVLKVIIEACLLSEDEKIEMCKIVTDVGADFIKTSTGFSVSGATFDDVALFKKHVGSSVKIKAAGGIKTIEAAEKFIELGAERLGTSSLVQIAKKIKNQF